MKTLKYSRQRESIKACLMGRKDHPTADALYTSIREQFPNISLGTVYRNLALLSELGEIKKLTTGDGADHFDGNVSPHQHVICKECHRILDLELNNLDYMKQASSQFDGEIDSCTSYFYGTCADCLKK